MILQAGDLCKCKHSVLYNLFLNIFVVCDEKLVKKHLKLYTGPAQALCDAGNIKINTNNEKRISASKNICKGKSKGKVHPRTGHEGPVGE
jgi:hypothetical protein